MGILANSLPKVALSATLILLAAAAVHAQDAPERTMARSSWGITGAVGFGTAIADVSCSNCGNDARPGTLYGSSGFVRLGGVYRSQAIIAVQADWWKGGSQDPRERTAASLATTNVVLQWYLPRANRWFLTGGLGMAFVSDDYLSTVDNGDKSARGLGYELGFGYEVPVGPHISITPVASYFGTPGSRIRGTDERMGGSVAQLAVGIGRR
ncbi:MAG TPA: outer membrane beta-barrel protein [Gemmatimonadaceae bacterium]|nr:outer membrane beta-barrel protein [Gemmatimonadaceae bacterium]